MHYLNDGLWKVLVFLCASLITFLLWLWISSSCSVNCSTSTASSEWRVLVLCSWELQWDYWNGEMVELIIVSRLFFWVHFGDTDHFLTLTDGKARIRMIQWGMPYWDARTSRTMYLHSWCRFNRWSREDLHFPDRSWVYSLPLLLECLSKQTLNAVFSALNDSTGILV